MMLGQLLDIIKNDKKIEKLKIKIRKDFLQNDEDTID